MKAVRWRDWLGSGLEHLILTTNDGFIRADSVVITGADLGFAVRYSIRLDLQYTVLDAAVSVLGSDTAVEIRSVGEGRWAHPNGDLLPHLDGAIDVDLPVTPFTNTLPIRRLQLSVGESADIETVYFNFPDLVLTRDPQRYTRLDENHYLYESRESDFARDIEVDQEGLVASYPGLFHRVAP